VGDASVYRRVVGWERKARYQSSRRGGSDIVLREVTAEVACSECITRLRAGVPAGQESLI